MLARQITEGRAQVEDLNRGVDTGAAIAAAARGGAAGDRPLRLQQRLVGTRRRAGRSRAASSTSSSMQLSGDPFEQDIREDGFGDYFDGYAGYSTVRTLCVRTCDGYYWPVSYSTIPDYVVNDADQCQQQCPGAEVELFYYNNPGQEAEQTINTDGMPYIEPAQRLQVPHASSTRPASCKQQINYGSDQHRRRRMAQSRAVIDFNGLNFPLPLRDPRRPADARLRRPRSSRRRPRPTCRCPLPRRRPAGAGRDAAAAAGRACGRSKVRRATRSSATRPSG